MAGLGRRLEQPALPVVLEQAAAMRYGVCRERRGDQVGLAIALGMFGVSLGGADLLVAYPLLQRWQWHTSRGARRLERVAQVLDTVALIERLLSLELGESVAAEQCEDAGH
jgi:hypothetical protein